MTTASAELRPDPVSVLLDREQARFQRANPRSAEAWEEGRRHFLYGGPSHWMRRWAGGFPVYVAEARGATQAEVALAWLAARPGVTAPIASATSVAQVESLIRAASLALSADDMRALNEASGI